MVGHSHEKAYRRGHHYRNVRHYDHNVRHYDRGYYSYGQGRGGYSRYVDPYCY